MIQSDSRQAALNTRTTVVACGLMLLAAGLPAAEDFRPTSEDAWSRYERARRRQQENPHLTYHREHQGLITSAILDAIRTIPGLRMPARTPDPWGNRSALSYDHYVTVWDRRTPFFDTPSLPATERSKDLRRGWSEIRLSSQQNLGVKWANLELSLAWHDYDLEIDDDDRHLDALAQPELDLVFPLIRDRFQNLSLLVGGTGPIGSMLDVEQNIFGGGGWGGHLGLRHSYAWGTLIYQSALHVQVHPEGETDIDDNGSEITVDFEGYHVRGTIGGAYRFSRQLRAGASVSLYYDRWDDLAGPLGELGDVDVTTIPARVFLEWSPSLRLSLQAYVGMDPFVDDNHDDNGDEFMYGGHIGGTF